MSETILHYCDNRLQFTKLSSWASFYADASLASRELYWMINSNIIEMCWEVWLLSIDRYRSRNLSTIALKPLTNGIIFGNSKVTGERFDGRGKP